MSQSNDKKTSNSVDEKLSPAVAGRSTVAKYVIVVLIAIVAVFIILNSMHHPAKKSSLNKDLVQPADTAAVHLNLGSNQEQAVPVVEKAPPPPALPDLSAMQHSQMNESRLKSPSLVYSANSTASSSSNSQSGSGDANLSYMKQVSDATVVTVSAKQTTNTNYKILQGKLIPAVLETAINSDLPGMTRAVVSEDVYGDTGRVVLLPRGTRLVGQYNSTVSVGQARVMVVWTRAITPNHVDIAIGSLGTDGTGESGMTGEVDSHFWKIFGNSALLSVLGLAGSSTSISGTSNSNLGVYGNPYQAAVIQGFLNNSGSLLQSRINIQPTIHVAQGAEIQVFVARDLDFSHLKYYGK